MTKVISVPISHEVWQEAMTEGHIINGMECIRGLPEGAEYLSSFYDDLRRTLHLVFYHESFRNVKPGEQMPQINPVLKYLEYGD